MIFDYSEYIVQKANKGIVNYKSIDTNVPFFNHDHICPFCKITTIPIHTKSKHDTPEWLQGTFDEYEEVLQCPNCGWWEHIYRNQSDGIIDGIRASDIEYSSAIVKKYDDSSKDVPITALRLYIEKNPDAIYKIDPHKMEELVRSIYADFYPSCKVKSFGKTRDGGKDAILIDDNGNQTLIQIKRRTNKNATESVVALRELIGVSVIEKNVKGCIFVTTADHFSKPAKDYAQNILDVHHVERFDLIDCSEFFKLVNLTATQIPTAWNKLIRL